MPAASRPGAAIGDGQGGRQLLFGGIIMDSVLGILAPGFFCVWRCGLHKVGVGVS